MVLVDSRLRLAKLYIMWIDRKKLSKFSTKENNYFWKYNFNLYGNRIEVCLKFFLNLLQITHKRIRTLQNKIINGKKLDAYFII